MPTYNVIVLEREEIEGQLSLHPGTLSEQEIERITSKVADTLFETGFWDILKETVQIVLDERDDEEEEIPESVTIIASGYDWLCPNCDDWRHEAEAYDNVTCPECGTNYDVDETNHAFPQ